MKFNPPLNLQFFADFLQCEYHGDPNQLVTGINEIHRVESGDIVFVDHPKYYEKALGSAATVIIINQRVDCPDGKALLFCDQPFDAFNQITKHFRPWELIADQSKSDVEIGEGSIVHPSVILGARVRIGRRCVIHPGVVFYNDVTVGDDCIIHANTIIGGDAFYYKTRPEGRTKMHTAGGVEIGDRVEIGCGCSIDRGVTAATIIGSGTKIDNQVHIGHDTIVGTNCLFAAQVGIAGCVVIEDHVILWGQVGVPSDVRIGKGAVVLGQSGLISDVEAGRTVFGSPADDVKTRYREIASLKKLPEIIRQMNK
jgi:UDP-3-O-[3-hydroxymyristoyl] glucosamine N-acyltransferase